MTLLQTQPAMKFDVKNLLSACFFLFMESYQKSCQDKQSRMQIGSAIQDTYFRQPHGYFKHSRVNVISHSSDTLQPSWRTFSPLFPLMHTFFFQNKITHLKIVILLPKTTGCLSFTVMPKNLAIKDFKKF